MLQLNDEQNDVIEEPAVPSVPPLYQSDNWGTEKLSNLFKLTQQNNRNGT